MKLNVEQTKIIEMEPSGHSLIKGVAGSGKTTVSVHRIDYLRRYFCPDDEDNILLVTFNKTLVKYIEYQYQALKNANQEPMDRVFQSNSGVDIQNPDKIMHDYFVRYQKRHGVKYDIAKPYTERNALKKAIAQLQEQYPEVPLLSPKNSSFLLDEINWIKACDIPDLDTYQQIDRIGRASEGEAAPQKLLKNSKTREAIYELLELYDKLLAKEGYVDFKTMNLMALEEAAEAPFKKYAHIMIDESQDLSKVQLKFLKLLHLDKDYASIMFVADNTQSIYSHSWLGKGRPYTTIGYDMSGRARTLSKNYRTTTQISQAAYGLIEQDEAILGNIDFVKPSLIDRDGHAPIYQYFTDYQKQADFLTEEINSLRKEYDLRDICIVAKENRLLESAASALEEAGIPSEFLSGRTPAFASDSVKLVSMHSIKGLEFKVVFLINLDEDVIPNDVHGLGDETTYTEERKLMYVGMTRANELLYMSSVKKPSPFIKEIKNEHIRMRRGSEIRPFQPIPIQDYRLTDQIVQLTSKEEVVRQWLLNELTEVYGYPEQLLTIEYEVQQFSKKGFVDIAVTIDVDGEKIPYIFAEVKAFDSGIDSATDQLKSYMRAEEHVQYGIVTDGVDLKLLDRNGKQISDVPLCQPQFLANPKQTRTYNDLRHHRTYHYVQNMEEEGHVEIIDPTTNLEVDVHADVPVPVIGDVAAGRPTTAIESWEERIPLPADWVIQEKATYALRVTGDSMIDAGMDKDDLVIVHQQETAENGDIVIALIGQEEATMKKFMSMGSNILLVSENKDYEPISMEPEDVVINGKVIGVLKNE